MLTCGPCQTNVQSHPCKPEIWDDVFWPTAGHSEMILHYDDVSTNCTIRVILDFIPFPSLWHTHTLVLTTNHETADLHHLRRIHNYRDERKVSQCIDIQDTAARVICMHMHINSLSLVRARYLTHTHTHTHIKTHNLWLPPSAVRQTEGRGDDEGSQVARVQAVVCTVISAQVFKQPDVHIETGGEAVILDTYINRDVR